MIKIKKENFSIKDVEKSISNYISFDRSDELFYDNYYLSEIQAVMRNSICDDIGTLRIYNHKLEKFKLINRVFLISIN